MHIVRLFEFIRKIAVWLIAGIVTLVSEIFSWFVDAGLKKSLLSATFIFVYVGIFATAIICIKAIITPLIGSMSSSSITSIRGFSYMIPPVFSTALGAMIAARICVYVFKQQIFILNTISKHI